MTCQLSSIYRTFIEVKMEGNQKEIIVTNKPGYYYNNMLIASIFLQYARDKKTAWIAINAILITRTLHDTIWPIRWSKVKNTHLYCDKFTVQHLPYQYTVCPVVQQYSICTEHNNGDHSFLYFNQLFTVTLSLKVCVLTQNVNNFLILTENKHTHISWALESTVCENLRLFRLESGS